VQPRPSESLAPEEPVPYCDALADFDGPRVGAVIPGKVKGVNWDDISALHMHEVFLAARVEFWVAKVPGRFTMNIGEDACLEKFDAWHFRITNREKDARKQKSKALGKDGKSSMPWSNTLACVVIEKLFKKHFEGSEKKVKKVADTVCTLYCHVMRVINRSILKPSSMKGKSHAFQKHHKAAWQIIMNYLLKFTDPTVGEGEGGAPVGLGPDEEGEGSAPDAPVYEEREPEGSLQEGDDAKGEADCDTDAVTSSADEGGSE
jgi:hypothetical protein